LKKGFYVDIVLGRISFFSTDKYDLKTGCPSFTKPLKTENNEKVEDRGLFTVSTSPPFALF
jgi:peptide methionine sulfoxide reductase msrA/msrB